MDHEPRRSGSFGRISSAGSSFRRRSMSLSGALPSHVDDDTESETVSQAGDIGDRALHSNRYSGMGSFHLSGDNAIENAFVDSIAEGSPSRSYGFSSSDPKALNSTSPVSLLPVQNVSPLFTDLMVRPEDTKEDIQKVMPQSLEYILCLIHLAVFGILGVLTRYLLQKLFGPGVAGVTSDQSILYLDLPSNMVGSFLMGWWGVVFKGDISHVSEYLAIGLSTGYLGSLTTFSGWNQKMLDLSVNGKWLFAILGFFIGLFLAAYSIIFGVETAKGFKFLLQKMNVGSRFSSGNWRVDSSRRHFSVGVVLILIFAVLWGISGALVKKEFENGGSRAQLWLGCMVAPLGVWTRWFLARLNGRGLGKEGYLKWVPFGTLIANVSAACVMAALSTVKEAVRSKNCDTVTKGIQFGLMGCLSTVSTFMAEFNAMRESAHPWRAYVYALTTILVSFGLGTLIYSLPVWANAV